MPWTRMAGAAVRLEVIDTINYPMNAALEQLGLVAPVMFSYFFARLLPPGDVTVGGDYFTFAVIGYAIFVLLQGTFAGLGQSIQFAQNIGTLETLLVEPAPWRLLPLVLSAYPVIARFVTSLAVILVGLSLGATFDVGGVVPFIGVALVGMIASLGMGIIIASLLVLAKRANVLLASYSVVASIMAGSVFPVRLMPEWLRWIAYILPETYVIDAGRQLLMTNPPPPLVPAGTATMILVGIALVAGAVGTLLFGRSLEFSRRMGLLGGY